MLILDSLHLELILLVKSFGHLDLLLLVWSFSSSEVSPFTRSFACVGLFLSFFGISRIGLLFKLPVPDATCFDHIQISLSQRWISAPWTLQLLQDRWYAWILCHRFLVSWDHRRQPRVSLIRSFSHQSIAPATQMHCCCCRVSAP